MVISIIESLLVSFKRGFGNHDFCNFASLVGIMSLFIAYGRKLCSGKVVSQLQFCVDRVFLLVRAVRISLLVKNVGLLGYNCRFC